jgi:hypothetical protein
LLCQLIATLWAWELVARSFDGGPPVPLGEAELALRLGLAEAIAARLAPPVPKPPTGELLEWNNPRPPTALEQQLAAANWALGFWCGRSFPGGVICKDKGV